MLQKFEDDRTRNAGAAAAAVGIGRCPAGLALCGPKGAVIRAM